MAIGILTVWIRAPEVPVRVSITLPAAAAAPASAVIVTFCAVPGVIVSIVGCAVIPLGNPVIATVTIPVKPLTGAEFRLVCCPAPPGTSVIVAGVGDNEKSAAGLELPLQQIKAKHKRRLEHTPSNFEKRPI